MNSQEYDQIEEAANRLQHEASVKCSRELEKAQKYKEGYTQGVEDLLRCIRRGEGHGTKRKNKALDHNGTDKPVPGMLLILRMVGYV